VINANLPPILYRLRDVAFEMSQIAIFGYPLAFKPPTEGFPWDDLRKIFRGCQRMAKVSNGKEKLPIISTGWVGCTNVTDRRKTDDRRTGDSI